MERGSQVLVMSEHWLWHFEPGRLEQISGEHEATGKTDGRLTEVAEGGRGLGGIGILWHKSIGAYSSWWHFFRPDLWD